LHEHRALGRRVFLPAASSPTFCSGLDLVHRWR
jgi:hypothetical protein